MAIVSILGTSILAVTAVICSPILTAIIKVLVAIISAYLFEKVALPIAKSLGVWELLVKRC